jgi:hypothetical protein
MVELNRRDSEGGARSGCGARRRGERGEGKRGKRGQEMRGRALKEEWREGRCKYEFAREYRAALRGLEVQELEGLSGKSIYANEEKGLLDRDSAARKRILRLQKELQSLPAQLEQDCSGGWSSTMWVRYDAGERERERERERREREEREKREREEREKREREERARARAWACECVSV